MFIWVLLTSVHSNAVAFAVEKFPPYKSNPESAALQPAFEIWDQFKKERDAYIQAERLRQFAKSQLLGNLRTANPGELEQAWGPALSLAVIT